MGIPGDFVLCQQLSHHIIRVSGVVDAVPFANAFKACGGNAVHANGQVLLAGTESTFRHFLEQPDIISKAALVAAINPLIAPQTTPKVWRCRDRDWHWDTRTCVMGIVNVTPDSFSDGGRFFEPSKALEHALQLVEEGSDILDIGGESSRPGAESVPLHEELRRVIPLVQEITRRCSVLISVDTYKHKVAAEALSAGAHIVNDITALSDPRMTALVAEYRSGLVLMHMQGTPQTMQQKPSYTDVVADIYQFLHQRIQAAVQQDIPIECLAVDPGVGFGKTLEHNIELLKRIQEFSSLNVPILIGTSRKSFIGRVLDRPTEDRLFGTAATVACAILRGVHIVRVHDVSQMKQIATMTDALR